MANRPAPLNTAMDTNGEKLSPVWQQWFQQLSTFVSHLIDYTEANVQAPLAGFSISMSSTDKILMLTPAGVLATGTIVLPSSPYDGQPVQVSSTKTVTSLNVSPAGTETVFNAPTTLAGGAGFSYFFRSSDNAWYRLY